MSTTNNAGVEFLSDRGSDGTSLGNAATDLVSVYGETPVVQADNISAAGTTVSVSTAVGAVTSWGYSGSTQANAIISNLNSLNTAIQNFGITASS